MVTVAAGPQLHNLATCRYTLFEGRRRDRVWYRRWRWIHGADWSGCSVGAGHRRVESRVAVGLVICAVDHDVLMACVREGDRRREDDQLIL